MVDDLTNGRRGTDIVQQTRVQTLVLDTGLGGIAISINETLNLFAEFVGVSDESWRT